MTLLSAPMEGLLDFVLRDVPTRVGGVDRCVSEFRRGVGPLPAAGRSARPAGQKGPLRPSGREGVAQ